MHKDFQTFYILNGIVAFLQLYEKRGRVVKEKEMAVWKDILPSMMSEEETDNDGFLWRRQCWKLFMFLTKLDNRNKKLHEREAMELLWMLLLPALQILDDWYN